MEYNAAIPQIRQMPNYNVERVKAVHFDDRVSPWNLHRRMHRNVEFDDNYDPELFWNWSQRAYSFPNQTSTVCDSVAARYTRLHQAYRVGRNSASGWVFDGFTIILSTWDGKRVNLTDVVRNLVQSQFLKTVIVLFHSPDGGFMTGGKFKELLGAFPEYKRWAERKGTKLVFERATHDSLANRFLPFHNLGTPCVVSMDDDMLVDPVDLDFGFRAWQRNPRGLSGPFTRSHEVTNQGVSYLSNSKYEFPFGREYSMVLTKLMYAPASYYFIFSCVMPRSIEQFIAETKSGEDMAFNLLASAITSRPPMNIDIETYDVGTYTGLSAGGNKWLKSRSKVLSRLVDLFGINPLRYGRAL
jgi:alpha-1,4-N-acetylglucosaminyltransferase EXTL3